MLDNISSERKFLISLLDRIGRDLGMHFMETPIFHDGWSIKDNIAHITECELAMIRCLNSSLKGETPQHIPFGLPEEEENKINAYYFQQNKHKPIGQVTDEAYDAYQLVIGKIKRVSEDDLFDPRRFDWLAGKPFWPIVASNTCWHYKEHRVTIKNAL